MSVSAVCRCKCMSEGGVKLLSTFNILYAYKSKCVL